MNKNIWVNTEELNQEPEFLQAVNSQEFKDLTAEELAEGGSALTSKRRDFLKFLGFSVGAATLAGCEIPVKKAIPYTVRPEEIVPGIANYYASSFVNAGDYCSVLIKTREGRPIKIEGNPLSSVTKGGTSARAQASVLSLYDVSRLAGPKKNGSAEDISWTDLDAAVKGGLAGAANIYIMTHTQMSPSLRSAMDEFKAKYPNTTVVTYDPISASALLEANQDMFGAAVVPSYHFDKAKVIVSFDADFLGTWISPIEYAGDYAKGRKAFKMKEIKSEMSRHIQLESRMSLTGSNADNRILVKPSEQGIALALLYNEVAAAKGEATVSVSGNFAWAKATAAIKKAAKELVAAQGQALVVCGVNNKSMQLLVNKLNAMLGAYGSTIDMATPSYQRQGSDKALADMLGKVSGSDAVIVYNCNPAYDIPGRAAEFAEKLKGAKLSVSLSGTPDETARLCQYTAPDNHVLESWGDVEAKAGKYSLIQPTIRPIFNTRQAGVSFLTWGASANLQGGDQPYYEYVKQVWNASVFGKQSKFATFQGFWDSCVHDGVFETPSAAASTTTGAAFDVASVAAGLPKPSGSVEVCFYEPMGIGNGAYANNPWLQEMPDPVMRTVWDNFIAIPIKYNAVGNYFAGLNELKDGDLATIKVNGEEITLPVVRQFGQMDGTVAIALGYGRTAAGRSGNNVGKNLYPQVKDFTYSATCEVGTKNGKDEWFACVQMHHTYGIQTDAKGKDFNVDEYAIGYKGFQGSLTGRSVFYSTTADEYEKDVEALQEKRAEAQHLNSKGLYPDYSDIYGRGHHWGMSIDLSACIGCGACTVACMSENNVPVVGKREVARVHEMTWLRIDRYFYGNEETPNTAYMPMMCQHCQNAPCENVCPVNATNHSSEGHNQMTYNRCIGTRYCANNCPFKVRRFNWLDYTSADLFPWNEVDMNWGTNNEKEHYNYMTESLTRMVLNPDVTVRSRGVIEKCSLCIHRTQQSKLTAKAEGRPLRDGDAKTACQTACPTGAIVFGDRNDKESALMSTLWETPLNYIALEEINVLPTVTYLMKVTNTKEDFYS